MHTLIATAKLNDIDPSARLANVLRRINDHPASRPGELVPWNWGAPLAEAAAAQPRFADEEARCRPRHAAHLPRVNGGWRLLDTRGAGP